MQIGIGETARSNYMEHAIVARVQIIVRGLLLSLLGLCAFLVPESTAETTASRQNSQAQLQSSDNSEVNADPTTFEDGVYLYGQQPEAEQLGQTYLVFESRHDRVLGAFYMPHSSFDCFYGTVNTGQLALTVVESYSQEAYTYALALETQDPVAAIDDTPLPVSLKGFHRLETMSDNDQRILGVCRTEYRDAIWN